MNWYVRIGVFAGVLVLALVATAPARAFLHPRSGDIAIASIDGAIWQPVLRGVRVGKFDAGDVRLSLSPGDLLVGRIAVDARINGPDLTGEARVELGIGGAMRLQATSLVLAIRPESAAAAGLPAGSVRMSDVDVRFVDGACSSAQGRVTSDMASAAAELMGQTGPVLEGNVSCMGEAVRLPLAGERDNDAAEAWLDLRGDGTGEWSAAYTTDKPDVAVALAAAGFAPRDAPGSFANKGKVRWLPL